MKHLVLSAFLLLMALLYPISAQNIKSNIHSTSNESKYRGFLRLDIHFASSLNNRQAFDTIISRLPSVLSQNCFFSPNLPYKAVVSSSKNTYSLYTIIPSSSSSSSLPSPPFDTSISSDLFDDIKLRDKMFDFVEQNCSDAWLSRALLKLNLLPSEEMEQAFEAASSSYFTPSLNQLLISHISKHIEYFPEQECIIQIKNPKYIRPSQRINTSQPSTSPSSSNNPNNHNINNIHNNHNIHNNPSPSGVNLESGPSFEKYLEHYIHSEKCPKKGELIHCSQTDQCNAAAGSVCKFYFNKATKRNEQFCSIVHRFKDYHSHYIILGSMLVLQCLYLFYVISTCPAGNFISQFMINLCGIHHIISSIRRNSHVISSELKGVKDVNPQKLHSALKSGFSNLSNVSNALKTTMKFDPVWIYGWKECVSYYNDMVERFNSYFVCFDTKYKHKKMENYMMIQPEHFSDFDNVNSASDHENNFSNRNQLNPIYAKQLHTFSTFPGNTGTDTGKEFINEWQDGYSSSNQNQNTMFNPQDYSSEELLTILNDH